VTLARILDIRGELDRRGLVCERCERDPVLKRSRGCGRPPQELDLAGDPLKPWDVVEWLENEQKRRRAPVRDAPMDATKRYAYALTGGVWDILGTMWPHCPAWYARFYEGRETIIARRATRLAVAIQRGTLPLIHDGGELSPIVNNQVGVALNALQYCNNRAEERRAEARKAANASKGSKGGFNTPKRSRKARRLKGRR